VAPSAAGTALGSVDAALREVVTERLVEDLVIDPDDLQVVTNRIRIRRGTDES
jgi:hypothetical protein